MLDDGRELHLAWHGADGADMEYLAQQLINGLTLGSIYGLIAIGYTMVFGIIGMVNFAHGDVFMVSTFIALIFLHGADADPGHRLAGGGAVHRADPGHAADLACGPGRSSGSPIDRCAAPSASRR